MPLIDVDFVFSCSCFVSEIKETLLRSKKNYVIAACFGKMHVDHFKEERTSFVCYFYHISEGMQFDTCKCLHFYKRVFFDMCHDGSLYKNKKCFRCYRRSIKSLFKYYVRFIC